MRVLSYARRGPAGEITIEQDVLTPACPECGSRAWVKDRPVVSYVDLPFGGVPISIRWKKHRLFCPDPFVARAPSRWAITGSPPRGAC